MVAIADSVTGKIWAILFLELLFGIIFNLYVGKLSVSDRRQLDDSRRDGIDVGVLCGGGYGSSGHSIGSFLSLYRPFTDLAWAVV